MSLTLDYITPIPTEADLPHPLGRAFVNHDPRNLNFLALVEPPERAEEPCQAWWTRDVYDQGSVPRCTAEAAVGMLRTAPFRPGFRESWVDYDAEAERQALYLEAQRHDPWPGEAYEGSSVDAPFKVLRNRGVISAWRWLLGEAELRDWLTWYGPAVVGTYWLGDMFSVDEDGFIHARGGKVGGHAYRIVQYSDARDAYRIVNSWGRGWGRNGRCWISSTDMAALLADDGEAVTIA